jgi:hypothetical protein
MQPGIAGAEGAPCVNPTLAGVPLTFGGIINAVLPEDFEDVRHQRSEVGPRPKNLSPSAITNPLGSTYT